MIEYNMYNMYTKPEHLFFNISRIDQSLTFGRKCNKISFKN